MRHPIFIAQIVLVFQIMQRHHPCLRHTPPQWPDSLGHHLLAIGFKCRTRLGQPH
jgi:hypothetical protein